MKNYYTKLSDIEQIKFIDECIKNNVNVGFETRKTPISRDYPFICAEVDKNGEMTILLMNGSIKSLQEDIKLSPIKFKQFVRNYKNPIKVKLNNNYDAIIKSNKIIVGCQEFPLSIIKDLAKAAKIKL